MLRTLTLGLLATTCLLAPANAADIRAASKAPIAVAAPVANWSGGYFGLHGGWGFGQADLSFAPGSTFPGTALLKDSTDLSGGIGGFHVGHNWQFGNLVLGIEGSTAWSGIKGNDAGLFATLPLATYKSELQSLSTLTGRVGWALDSSWLLYAKGGLAYGTVRGTVTNGAVNYRETTDHVGWTIGAGVEYALTPNWIVGVEYNYVNLADERYGGFASNGAITDFDSGLAVSTVLARLSYKFGPTGNPIATWILGPEMPGGAWNGVYLGVHGGYGWGNADHRFALGAVGDVDVSGGLGGLHLGYLSQRGNWVFGPEFAITLSGLSGSDRVPTGGATIAKIETSWLATKTLRLGYTWNNWMLYGKGGTALANVDSTLTFPAGVFKESNIHIGWTLGGGLEYALTPNWIVGLEYNYVDLGRQRYGSLSTNGAAATDYKADLAFSTVLARLSYKFGDPAPTVVRKY